MRFLFAVARDVQRNWSSSAPPSLLSPPTGFYSLSRETYSGTVYVLAYLTLAVVFLFAVARDVQRNASANDGLLGLMAVSIRCRARRTAERRVICFTSFARTRFLFAVARDVQRN